MVVTTEVEGRKVKGTVVEHDGRDTMVLHLEHRRSADLGSSKNMYYLCILRSFMRSLRLW